MDFFSLKLQSPVVAVACNTFGILHATKLLPLWEGEVVHLRVPAEFRFEHLNKLCTSIAYKGREGSVPILLGIRWHRWMQLLWTRDFQLLTAPLSPVRFAGVAFARNSFQLHNSIGDSEQVCHSCWIRHDGMSPLGNTCQDKKWDPWGTLQGFGRRFNAHFLNNFLLRRVGRGICHMRWDFQGGNWQVPRKAQNEAWGGVWFATHFLVEIGTGIICA